MTGRAKRIFSLPQAEVEAFILDVGIASPVMIADHFGVHVSTVQRKLDGLLHQDKVIVDEYSSEGHALLKPHWRYAINEEADHDTTSHIQGG